MRKQPALVTCGVIVLTLLSAVAGCPQTGSTSTGGGGSSVSDSFALAPTVVLTSDVTIGVLPLTVNFTSTLSTDDGLIASRFWDFGDGAVSTALNPEHTYTSTGVFTVTLTLTDDQDASASETVEITVTEAPVSIFTISPESATAENAPATFSFDPTGSFDPDGTLVEYQWDFGDGALLTLTDPEVVSHIYSRGGNYRIELTVVDDIGVETSFNRSVRVGIPQPTIEFVTPPATTRRIVVPQDGNVWAAIKRNVEIGVPAFLRAGLDRDFDQCDAKAIVYVVGTGEEVAELSGHNDRILGAAFRPNDGERIVTASADETTRIYDQNGSFVLAFDSDSTNPSPVTAVDVAPLSGENTVFFYGLADGRIARQEVSTSAVPAFFTDIHTAQVNAIAISADGSFAVSGGADSRVRAWQTATGTILSDATNGGIPHAGPINDVSVAAAANIVASASDDQTVRVWQSSSFNTIVREFTGHAAAVNAVALSPNGERVISGDAAGKVFYWSPTDTAILMSFDQSAAVTAVAFAPDPDVSRIAIGTATGEVRIYDPTLGAVALVTLSPCTSPITALEFSSTGAELLVGIGAANSIQLDDVDSANGNDLNLTDPVPLGLAQVDALHGQSVEAGTYYLWADLATDRTTTERTYAGLVGSYTEPTEIIVVPQHSASLASAPARIPYAVGSGDALRDLADPRMDVQISPPSGTDAVRRQIIDIGRLEAGDQIIFSFLTVPGFSPYYRENSVQSSLLDLFLFEYNIGSDNDGAYSALLLNELTDGVGTVISPANMLAWYATNACELFPETRITIRNASDHHYIVVDSASSLRIEISQPSTNNERDLRLEPQNQRVLLDFSSVPQTAIGGIDRVDILAFDIQLAQAGLTPAEVETVKTDLVARLQTLFADASFNDPGSGNPRGVQFYRSDIEIPETPYKRILFGSLLNFPNSEIGTLDVKAAQGETETGSAIVGINAPYVNPLNTDTTQTLYDFDPADIGNCLGNAAGHILGLMLGLQATDNPSANDVMDTATLLADPTLTTLEFTNGPVPAFDEAVGDSIGEQNADLYLADIYGPAAP